MKFVVYEIWSRAVIVDAEDTVDALQKHVLAEKFEQLTPSNWHAVELDEESGDTSVEDQTASAVENLQRNLERIK